MLASAWPENNEQIRVLSFDEQRLYLSKANGTLRDVATLMLETEMRPEEVYRITVQNGAIDQGYVFVPFGKQRLLVAGFR